MAAPYAHVSMVGRARLRRDINSTLDWMLGEFLSRGMVAALKQMFDELERGCVYMRMAWNG